jgi:hypothetical protein
MTCPITWRWPTSEPGATASGAVVPFLDPLGSSLDDPSYLSLLLAHVGSRFPIRVSDVVLMRRRGKVGLIRRRGPGDREAAQGASMNGGLHESKELP